MFKSFEATIQRGQEPVAADFRPPGNELLVAFGGISAGLGMPPFEFFRIATTIPTKRLFVRDLQQVWYHGGLPGVSDSVETTCTFLRTQIADQGINHSMFVGNSMGAYAAILFGAMLRVDVVHAFSPQTFLDPGRRLLHGDLRWTRRFLRLYARQGVTSPFFDLRRVLVSQGTLPRIHLHFDESHPLDRAHCQRLEGLSNVVLHPHRAGGHMLVRHLRDQGLLADILQEGRPLVPGLHAA